jgi:hypothetical protein
MRRQPSFVSEPAKFNSSEFLLRREIASAGSIVYVLHFRRNLLPSFIPTLCARNTFAALPGKVSGLRLGIADGASSLVKNYSLFGCI